MFSLKQFFDMKKKRKLLKRCAICGRKPKILNCHNGWFSIECSSVFGRYHYGVSFSRGQYNKHFVDCAKSWNDLTYENNKVLDL